MVRRRIDEFIADSHDRGYSTGRSRDDTERIIKATIETTIAYLAKGIFEELRAINERLDRIEARLDSIENRLKSTSNQARSKGHGRLLDSIAEVLSSDGFIIGSASRSKLGISPQRLLSIASELGDVVVVDAGSDFIIFTRNSLDKFKTMLREISIGDPYEAASRLGKYGDAFNLLRAAGLVYYDGKRRSWRMLE